MRFARVRTTFEGILPEDIDVVVEIVRVGRFTRAAYPRLRLDPDGARRMAAELLVEADKADAERLLRTPCPPNPH